MQFTGSAVMVAGVLLATAAAVLIRVQDPVAADNTGVGWTWKAPEGCPDEATTRRELVAATRTACTLGVNARVERSGADWRLDLQLRGQGNESTRTLTAATCRALADAAIVIVMVACAEETRLADPVSEPPGDDRAPTIAATNEATLVPPVPPTAPADAPGVEPRATAPSREAPPTRLDAPVASARRRLTAPIGEIGLRSGVAWAPTLAPAANLGLSLRLRWPRVDLLLSGAYTSARSQRYEQQPMLGVTTRLAHVGLAVCPALEWGRGLTRGRAALCAELAVGAMFGTGFGAPINVTRPRPWFAVGLTPTLGWLLHPRVSLGLGVDLLVSLVRPAFELEGLPPLVRAAPFGVRLHTTIFIRMF